MKHLQAKQNILGYSNILLVLFLLAVSFFGLDARAQSFNQQVNYQAKLTDNVGATIADGVYNVEFKLYTQASGGSAIWTETASTTVTSGLFSYMLGSSSSLAGINFDQTLYLGVNIGGIGSPVWDGEMIPRKVFGTVPAAFEAKNAQTLAGVATTSFLRSDQDDTASGLLIFTGGFISSGSSTIANILSTSATTTNFSINGDTFSDFTGSGLELSAGALIANISESNLNIAAAPINGYILQASSTAVGGFAWQATSSLGFPSGHDAVSLVGEDFLSLSGQQITANAIDPDNLSASDFGDFSCNGTICSFDANTISATELAGGIGLSTFTDDIGYLQDITGASFLDLADTPGSFSNTQLLYMSGSDITSSGNLTFDGSTFSVQTTGVNDILNLFETGGTEVFTVLENGSIGVGTSTPGTEFSVSGDVMFEGGIYDNNYSRGTNGMVLQTTGSGFNWVSTSTLGFAAAGTESLFTDGGASTYLTSLTDNLGIGTTSPASKLDVWGDFRVGTSGTPALFVDASSSKVGIGTTSPNALLAIEKDFNTSAAAFKINTSGGTNNPGFRINFVDAENEVRLAGANSTPKLSLGNNANSYLTVDTSGGNVGIGTTSPASKLDVWGDFRVGTGSTPILFADVSSGRVGIGTTSPQATFTVAPAATTIISDGFEDNTLLPFTTSGNVNWAVQGTEVNSGSFAAQAGAISHSQSSTLTYSTTTTQAGHVSFWYKVSSEVDFDNLSFRVDGETKFVESGEVGWMQYTAYLGAGAHTLQWVFTRDPAAGGGSNSAWVDDLLWTAQPTQTLLAGQTGIGELLSGTALNVSGDLNVSGLYKVGGESVFQFLGENIFVGKGISSTVTGNQNMVVGNDAGAALSTGIQNTILGNNSGALLTSGINNTLVGSGAGPVLTTGEYNFFGGANAGLKTTNGDANTFLGAGAGAFTATGNNNTTVGAGAGAGVDGQSYSRNSFFGYNSGNGVTTGSNNILLGYQAADSLTTGANNIVIGYDVEAPSNTASNQLNIGNLVFSEGIDGTGSTLSAGNIGIGTSSPASKLDVWGDFLVGTSSTPLLLADTADSSIRFGFLGGGLLTTDATGVVSTTSASSLGLGTVTSVDASVPTGWTIANNPITTSGTLAFAYDTGYAAVLSASTTNWNNFFNTPSTQITAGDALEWSTNTLNVNDVTAAMLASSDFGDFTCNGTTCSFDTSTVASSTLNAPDWTDNYVLQASSTAVGGFAWVATSTLGFAAAGTESLFTDGGASTYLTSLTDNLGIGTTSPASKLDVWGDFRVGTSGTPALFVDTAANGVGIGTSTLGATDLLTLNAVGDRSDISILYEQGGSTRLIFQEGTGTAGTFTITADGSSNAMSILNGSTNLLTLADDKNTFNPNGVDMDFVVEGATDTNLLYINAGTDSVGIGTTSPSAKFSIDVQTLDGAGVVGIDQYLQTENSVASAVQYGNRFFLNASNTATTTIVGSMYRLADDTIFGNTVRGLEVQTNRGSNTQGENTALSGFARTFGVRGVTTGDAGGSFEPAGGFFETEGTSQGNAVRGFSSSITSASLLSLFQDTSTFTGTGLEMNFGNTTGDFSSSTSKYLDFQNAGTSVFTVSAFGTTTIGDGTTNNMAGLQIGYGGICVDNDGACVASTTGNITAVSYGTANSDLAETYFSNTDLEPGELVTLAGGLSIDRAEPDADLPILGVVSTKPGLTLGFDDRSLNAGEEAYPIALRGRVPVKLSTENGPIRKGDRLMLSSLPGVAMKATGTGMNVGIALEDFSETRMYSDTYLNQFGDDMVDPIYEPVTSNADTRINDGCYYGGGSAAGEADCIPLVSTTTLGQIEEVNERLEEESVAEQIADLERIQTDSEYLSDGTEVKVGQIVMFVENQYRWVSDSQLASLGILVGSDMLNDAEEGETLLDRLIILANSFVDGVFSVFTLRADRIDTEQLCIDDVCVTAEDLQTLLDNASNFVSPTETSETNSNDENYESTDDIDQNNEDDTSPASPDSAVSTTSISTSTSTSTINTDSPTDSVSTSSIDQQISSSSPPELESELPAEEVVQEPEEVTEEPTVPIIKPEIEIVPEEPPDEEIVQEPEKVTEEPSVPELVTELDPEPNQ